MKIALISLYDDYAYAARFLATYLKANGHQAYILNLKTYAIKMFSYDTNELEQFYKTSTATPLEELRTDGIILCPYPSPVTDIEKNLLFNKLKEIQPDVIGFSVMSIDIELTKALTRRVKGEFPNIPVIWGGIHPTITPEESIGVADIICIGEGEEPLLELINNPQRTDIKNLWFRKNGKIIKNELRPLEQNLDRFPIPIYGEDEFLIEWNKIEELKIHTHRDHFMAKHIILTQRGCPYSCNYCAHVLTRQLYKGQKYIRRISVDKVLDEVELRIKQFNPDGVCFWDDVFFLNYPWLTEFAEKYPERIGLPFGGYAHPQSTSEEMIKILKPAGLSFIAFGVQTGSEYIGKEIYGRTYPNEDIVRLAKLGEKYGLEIVYDIISNCPYEREEDLVATLKFLYELPRAGKISIKKLRFYKHSRLGQLNKPLINLNEDTYFFYNMLFLLMGEPNIPQGYVMALAKDDFLRKNPRILAKLAENICGYHEKIKLAEDELKKTKWKYQNYTGRGLLSYTANYGKKKLPKGIFNALKNLFPKKVRETLKS